MSNMENLGIVKTLTQTDFEQAKAHVTEKLTQNGFGVLTEINVTGTFKKKLGAEFRDYHILGACNPQFAHKALSTDLAIGLLMPCNVILARQDDGTIVAAAVRPSRLFPLVQTEGVKPVADEIEAMLQNAMDAL